MEIGFEGFSVHVILIKGCFFSEYIYGNKYKIKTLKNVWKFFTVEFGH